MCIIELAINTNTADSRIGNHNAVRATIRASCFFEDGASCPKFCPQPTLPQRPGQAYARQPMRDTATRPRDRASKDFPHKMLQRAAPPRFLQIVVPRCANYLRTL